MNKPDKPRKRSLLLKAVNAMGLSLVLASCLLLGACQQASEAGGPGEEGTAPQPSATTTGDEGAPETEAATQNAHKPSEDVVFLRRSEANDGGYYPCIVLIPATNSWFFCDMNDPEAFMADYDENLAYNLPTRIGRYTLVGDLIEGTIYWEDRSSLAGPEWVGGFRGTIDFAGGTIDMQRYSRPDGVFDSDPYEDNPAVSTYVYFGPAWLAPS